MVEYAKRASERENENKKNKERPKVEEKRRNNIE